MIEGLLPSATHSWGRLHALLVAAAEDVRVRTLSQLPLPAQAVLRMRGAALVVLGAMGGVGDSTPGARGATLLGYQTAGAWRVDKGGVVNVST